MCILAMSGMQFCPAMVQWSNGYGNFRRLRVLELANLELVYEADVMPWIIGGGLLRACLAWLEGGLRFGGSHTLCECYRWRSNLEQLQENYLERSGKMGSSHKEKMRTSAELIPAEMAIAISIISLYIYISIYMYRYCILYAESVGWPVASHALSSRSAPFEELGRAFPGNFVHLRLVGPELNDQLPGGCNVLSIER